MDSANIHKGEQSENVGSHEFKKIETGLDREKASGLSRPAESDEEYWEEMLFISRGPTGWNIGCGCG